MDSPDSVVILRRFALLCWLFLAAAGIAGCSADGGAAAAQTVAAASDLGFLSGRDVRQPQFASTDGGLLYVVWREAGEGGSNLLLSRRDDSRVFGPPVRINDVPNSVANIDLDEMRVEVGMVGDFVGVAWTTQGADIRAAVSRDGGVSFEPSVNLNSDEGSGAYHGFVGTDIDARGVLHAAWIDGRYAPSGHEEPAELMYARLEDGVATERNLTADQTESICGCCRVDVDLQGESVVIAFRNTESGYRDIFRVVGDLEGVFGVPTRLGPPMWKLRGCPTFGPANVGRATVWGEASMGKRRLLAATGSQGDFQVLLEDSDGWSIRRPPRAVINTASSMILVPGRPTGKLLVSEGESWSVVADDLPPWAMSAVLESDQLTLLGASGGEVRFETRSLDLYPSSK